MKKIMLLPGTDAIEHPHYRKAASAIPQIQAKIDITRSILKEEYAIDLNLQEYMTGDHQPSVEGFQKLVLCSLATQVALCEMFQKSNDDILGILGLSLGDVARSVVAGICTYRDGVKQLFQFTTKSSMVIPGFTLQIKLSPYDTFEELCLDQYNLEMSIKQNEKFFLIAGKTSDVLDWVQQVAMKNNITFKMLYPFPLHSSLMQPVADSMKDDIASACKEGRPKLQIFSTVYGREINGNEMVNDCIANIASTLHFTDTIDYINTHYPHAQFVNIGPAPTLKLFIEKMTQTDIYIEDYFEQIAGTLLSKQSIA